MDKPITSKEYGQFFTPKFVANFMARMSTVSKDSKVLEPSFGNGVFLNELKDLGYLNITGYEIDESLMPVAGATLHYKSFVSAVIKEKYDLIIGNPPYIRWKNLNQELKDELSQSYLWQKYFNSLCDYLYIFILKSIEILQDDGELIFITPEYWINTKHAVSLRNYLMENGYFTDIIHFNETPIFEKVASSFIIFKYKKSKIVNVNENKIKVVKYHSKKRLNENGLNKISNGVYDAEIERFECNQFPMHKNWLLIPDEMEQELTRYEDSCSVVVPSLFESEKKMSTLGDIADIGNGMVSGLDRAFQLPANVELNDNEKNAIIKVLKAKNLDRFFHTALSNYIFLETKVGDEKELRENYPAFYNHLKPYQEQLEKRYSYNKKYNYWDWVFLRSYNLFSRDQERIFIPCKERISHKNYFRFALVSKCVYPTQDVTAIFLKPNIRESIYYILALLNTKYVFDWLKFKGVVKGSIVEFSEKPLASIPVRMINWSNPNEVSVHNQIVNLTEKYIAKKDKKILEEINSETEKLL